MPESGSKQFRKIKLLRDAINIHFSYHSQEKTGSRKVAKTAKEQPRKIVCFCILCAHCVIARNV